MKEMSQDVVDLLDHEGIDHVYGIGHDTGSHPLSRLSIYYPEKIDQLAFLTVGYTGMAQFDVDFI